jgi:cobalt-zinc-cadmium efflux system membrane fusion protein
MRRALLALFLLSLASCRRPEPGTHPRGEGGAPAEEKHDEKAGEEHHEEAAAVRIPEDLRRDLRITTALVEERLDDEGAPGLGELHVNEERYAEVSSPVAAQVTALRAAAGQAVREGHALAELTSPELGKARGAFHEADARARVARQALERKRSLLEERIVPAREVQEAEAEAQAAAAAQQAARAALESLGVHGAPGEGPRFVLRAPLAGTVIERTAVQGQVVEAGRLLFKVGDLRTLWVVAHASERDALRVRVGTKARVALQALPGRTLQATVTLVGREVEAASRTIPVRLILANEDGGLRPGMSATVWLPIGEGTSIRTVPAAALQRLRESWCVFVPKDPGVFEVRPVGRGRDLGGEVEVLSGLSAGETVVVEGAFLLKAEAEKAAGGGEAHEH